MLTGIVVKNDGITALPIFHVTISELPAVIVDALHDGYFTLDNPAKFSFSSKYLVALADVKNSQIRIKNLLRGLPTSSDGHQGQFKVAPSPRPSNSKTLVVEVNIGG